MAPGSDYLPGAVNPNLIRKRNRMRHQPGIALPDRTLEITMNAPSWRKAELDPFTEVDLPRIAQQYADHETILCDMDPDEARSYWDLEDGYLRYTPEGNNIRIGRGLINGQTSWWVDVQTQLAPTTGDPPYGWEYYAHFPGTFTADWVNWLYWHWLS